MIVVEELVEEGLRKAQRHNPEVIRAIFCTRSLYLLKHKSKGAVSATNSGVSQPRKGQPRGD